MFVGERPWTDSRLYKRVLVRSICQHMEHTISGGVKGVKGLTAGYNKWSLHEVTESPSI